MAAFWEKGRLTQDAVHDKLWLLPIARKSFMNTITPYLPGLLLVYSAFLLAVLSPGPSVLAIMGTAMHSGRKAGVCFAFGVVLGSITWGTLTVIGMSALLAQFGFLLIAIKIFGGVYLLFLAFKAFRAAGTHQDMTAMPTADQKLSGRQLLLRGYLVMITNPKAIFGWLAIVSLGVQDGGPWWIGIPILVGTVGLSFLVNVGYALLFSTSLMLAAYRRARRAIQAAFGAFFTFAGVKILSSA
ncbi:LysE family translocator [Roseibium sp.]|uniref:LysE family translocator n=1 Tax=Roseibium sp. TaxID=1936156 RepID=UPI003BB19560